MAANSDFVDMLALAVGTLPNCPRRQPAL